MTCEEGGRKPALFRLLIETAISGLDELRAAEDRDYVRAIRAEPKAASKLDIHARSLTRIHARLAPLFKVLQVASSADSDLAALWQEISQRRAANMRLFASDLAETGDLREDLAKETAADIIWSMNSPEFYLMLVEQRRWSPAGFEGWLADAWKKLLLRDQRHA